MADLYSNLAAQPKKKKKRKRRRRKAKPNSRAPLGQGGRFATLEQKLGSKPGRKKFGAKRFASLGR